MNSREILVLVIRTPKGQESAESSKLSGKGIGFGQCSEGQTTGKYNIHFMWILWFLSFCATEKKLLKKSS